MISSSVKVSAAPNYGTSHSQSFGGGLELATDMLVQDEYRGTLTWCERPPTLAQLNSQDTSFILPWALN